MAPQAVTPYAIWEYVYAARNSSFRKSRTAERDTTITWAYEVLMLPNTMPSHVFESLLAARFPESGPSV